MIECIVLLTLADYQLEKSQTRLSGLPNFNQEFWHLGGNIIKGKNELGYGNQWSIPKRYPKTLYHHISMKKLNRQTLLGKFINT